MSGPVQITIRAGRIKQIAGDWIGIDVDGFHAVLPTESVIVTPYPLARAYSVPRDLPVEHIKAGDLIEIGRQWAEVIAALECDGTVCRYPEICGGVLAFRDLPAVHYDALAKIPTRLPCDGGL